MGTISKNFSYHEFEHSDIAKEFRITNAITSVEVRDSIKSLVQNLLQPLRDAIGKPLKISSGYRCPQLNSHYKVGGSPTSQHCFDAETEILTDKGWKKYDEIKDDDIVLSYNVEADVIEPTRIDSIIIQHHSGYMMGFDTKQIDVLTTDKHRMLVKYENHKYVRKNTKNISPEGQKYFDSLKTDNDKWHIERAEDVFGKRRRYKSAGRSVAWNNADILFYKMCMAVIADGYFCYKSELKSVAIGFRFKKERKCIQLEELLINLGWHYTKSLDKNGVWNYYLRSEYGNKIHSVIGKDKHIPYDVLSFGSEKLRELVLYYALYDGCGDKRDKCNGVNIGTIIKHNADMLQAMCALSDMRCVCTKHAHPQYEIMGQKGVGKDYYMLSINLKRNECRVNEDRYHKKSYDGIVWCVNNKNTTVIVRRNGKVSIQGNCLGEAADVWCATMTPYELASEVLKAKLPFDQLILYSGFVHLSYKKSGQQRGQVLYNKSYIGKKLKTTK